MLQSIRRALSRARLGISLIALTYMLSVLLGAGLAHTGNSFALGFRDGLIARADASDPSLAALRSGDRLTAGLLDFWRNLLAGVADTVGGMAIIVPFPLAAYRGWVGGIVSVDDAHASRLAEPGEAVYYLVTLILQLVPYTLAGGMGVNLGISMFRQRPFYAGSKWLGLPLEAIRDAARVYLLIVPLFLIASLWEFLAR